MNPPTVLSTFASIGLVFVGILLSVVLPLAVRAIQKARGLEGLDNAAPPTFGQKLATAWKNYGGNRYLLLLLGATVVAVVIVLLLGLQFFTPRDAVLAGFAWESLINKTFAKDGGGNAPVPVRP